MNFVASQQRRSVLVSDAWPAPTTYHRSFCEHSDQRVGRSPYVTSALCSDFMAQSLASSIDVCRGLGNLPLRINIWLSYSQTDDNANAMLQSFLPKRFKKKWAEDTLVPPLWGKREKNVFFLFF